MSSNLKVNTILPSTGTAIGIGTASGNVDVLGHIVGHNTPNISGINSVTATTFYGSGANLTSIPAANLTGTLPAISAANLTNIPAGQLTGTVADARISTLTASKLTGALPAISGASLTNLPVPSTYNAVINGEMLISQRGSDFTGVNSSAYHLDRWYLYYQNSSAAFRIRHSGLSPDGFHQSYRVNVTTADTSIASNEEVKLIHKIEGFNLAPFAKGTSGAKKFTLSFYVKCNKTGTYVVEMYDRDNGRDVSGSYTVSNTDWNRYTIDFPADTTGEFGFDNGSSLEIMFWLVAGSAVQGGTLNTAWRSHADASSATGQVNFTDSTSNEWALTGVQLEPTTTGTASDFKHEGIAETLAKCHRYFYQSSHWGTFSGTGYAALGINYTGYNTGAGNWIWVNVYFPAVMRAAPTVDTSDQAGNTGNKHSIFTSTGGQRTNNVSNYHTSVFRDHCTVSNYWEAKYGVQVSGIKADAEL